MKYIPAMLTALLWLALPKAAKAQDPADSLVTYIAEAIRNNPAVMSQYRAYQAQVAAACGEGQLSDPELSVDAFPSPMQHVNVKQLATVTVMQMFPWFGTLKAGRQMMEQKAESTYQKFREDGIALAFDVQRQWYAMLAVQEQARSVRDKLRLLRDIEQVALFQYKSPTMAKAARMSDQLRLQTEEAALTEQVASLDDRLQLLRRQFNITMHRDPDAPLTMPDSIVLRQMPVIAWADIERDNPRLNQLLADGRYYEAQEAKARAMGKPMVGVGVQYMWNGKVDHPMMADMNGSDMVMPMLKVTLPIYRKKTNAARKAAALNREATVYGYQRQQDALHAEYLAIVQRAEDQQRKLRLYDQQLGILDNTLRLMQTEYAAGTTTLTDILATTRQQIDYALKKAEARAAYNTIVAEYEKMASKYGPAHP
jgi:Outer membrane protein